LLLRELIRQTTSQPFNYIVPQDNAFDWKAPIAGGNNTLMAENFYLFFKPLPAGDHTIDLHVIKQPLQTNLEFLNVAEILYIWPFV
jgi:hypothetical protein